MARTPQEKFERYIERNPRIVPLICQAAQKMKAQGRTHYGMQALVETLRYSRMETERAPDAPHCYFKISNACSPRLARLVMKTDKSLIGFFKVKPLTGETLEERLQYVPKDERDEYRRLASDNFDKED